MHKNWCNVFTTQKNVKSGTKPGLPHESNEYKLSDQTMSAKNYVERQDDEKNEGIRMLA